MIVVDNNVCNIFLPKIDRCKIDKCNLYQLVLQHKSSRNIVVFYVRDYASLYPAYYLFNFSIPDFMELGEYDLYLTVHDNWIPSEIDIANPKMTTRIPHKIANIINGKGIVCGGYLVMSNSMKALITFDDINLKSNGSYAIGNLNTCDETAYGNIFDDIDIIHSDILKYIEDKEYVCEPINQRNVVYKEYNR